MKDTVSIKGYFKLKHKLAEQQIDSVQKEIELKTKHLTEISDLRWKLSELAINKAETAMTQRMEDSNNKYALLKEQAAQLPNKAELDAIASQNRIEVRSLTDKVDLLSKLVYIGMGIFLVIEFVAKFILDKK